MSSSFTNTSTEPRMCPVLSMSRSRMPLKRACSASIAPATVAACTSMTSCSWVSRRSVSGMRTCTGMSGRHSGFLGRDQCFELAQARLDFTWFADMARHGIKGLEAVAGNAENRGIAGGNFPGGNQLLRHAHGHATSGLGKDAFTLGQQADAFTDFLVRHVV